MLLRLTLFISVLVLHSNQPNLSSNITNVDGNKNSAQSTEILKYKGSDNKANYLECLEERCFCFNLPPGIEANSFQKIAGIELLSNLSDSVFQKETQTIFKSAVTKNKKVSECRNETIYNTTIHWFPRKKKGAYSCPPCLDDNNLLVACYEDEDGHLVKDKECDNFQEPISYCPDGFVAHEYECCLVIEAATFDESSCPYNYQKSFDSIEPKCLPNEPVWFPTKRNLTYGLGEFYNLNVNNFYEIVIPHHYNDSIVNSSCIVYNNGNLEAVSCLDKYKRVCSYEYLHLNEMTYCMQRPGKCMNAFYDTTQMTCFCISKISDHCTLAEFLLPYQNSANFFSSSDLCRIGLTFDNTTNSLVWKSSGVVANYTNWLPYQPSPNTSVLQYVRIIYNGWVTTAGLTCDICNISVEQNYSTPNISINYENFTISVNLGNLESLVTTENNGGVVCLTNGLASNHISIVANNKDLRQNNFEFNIIESGQYWCEGLEIKYFKKIISNTETVVIHNNYTVDITFKYKKSEDPTSSKIAYENYIMSLERKYNERFAKVTVKWMQTLKIDEYKKHITYLLHFCTPFNKDNYTIDYENISSNLHNLQSTIEDIVIGKLYNYEYCSEEITCIDNNQTLTYEITCIDNQTLTWNRTEPGTSIAPNEICLDEDANKILRTCTWHFLEGARWSEFEPCYVYKSVEEISENTENLNELLMSDASPQELTNNLTYISKNARTFKPVDMFIISSIFKKLASNETKIANVTTVLSNLMATEPDVLKESQRDMNATDRILSNFDIILEESKVQYNNKSKLIQTKNLIVFIFDSNLNYSGLALLKTGNKFEALRLQRDIDADTISKIIGLEIATFLSSNILEEISLRNDPQIVIGFFLENSLFNGEAEQKVVAKAVSILLPPINGEIRVPIIFKPTRNLEDYEANCSFWGFDTMNSTKRDWVTESKPHNLAKHLYQCDFPHCTHFGLLLSHEKFSDEPEFDVINIVGVSLSTFGFCGIFLTATLFKNWRRNEGNKILLHFSAVSYLQIVAMHFSEYAAEYYLTCIALGAFLHYLVISEFLWMLIIAFLQHKRYIKVMQAPQQWILSKSQYICYILPLIPVLYLLLINPDAYVYENLEFCYPKGQSLIYTVLFPIGAILAVNALIFGQIFLVLSCRRSRACKQNFVGLKVKLLVLLFFLLGVTWLFGFAALYLESKFLMAVFVFLAPLQGFIIFLFFIVFNKNVRELYLKVWCKTKM